MAGLRASLRASRRAYLPLGLGLVSLGCVSASNNNSQGGGGAGGASAGVGGVTGGGVGGSATNGSGGNGSGSGGGLGTAGNSGAGGRAGAPGGGSAGSGGGATGPCSVAGLILCDDFESDAVGMEPSGGPWLAREPACPGSNPVPLVDTARATSSPGLRWL